MPTDAGPQSSTAPPPGGGGNARIQIDWSDLNTRRVDHRLKEQAALERNRRQAAMDPLSATTTALAAEDGGRVANEPRRRGGLLHHPAVGLALFGLLGGLLAWGASEAVRRAQPDLRAEAAVYMQTVRDYKARQLQGQMSAVDAARGLDSFKAAYADNPYFAVEADDALTDAQQADRLAAVDREQAPRQFVANLLGYALSGMLIAALLAAADPWLAGRRQAAVVAAAVGATAGLVGGAVVGLFVQQLYAVVSTMTVPAGAWNDHVATRLRPDLARPLAQAISWGVLGLFVALGPGLVIRNGKKLAIGLLGGFVGGAIGGATFDLVSNAATPTVSRGVTLVLIGVVTGLLVGLIEFAAKTGWLKVTAGLIAGKQFILYRNPTFIGSGPECPIYLFKDAAVGRRHAAVHAVPGGFEVENLPLGSQTLVNGRPVTRVRLRGGDEVQVGATRFRFQEKVKGNAER